MHDIRVKVRLEGLAAPLAAAMMVAVGLAACGGTPPKPTTEEPPRAAPIKPSPPATAKRGGGYYLDDGPGDDPPSNLDKLPDAVPRVEPLRSAANRPYEVFGRTYVPLTAVKPYRERGVASWYGRRYHGKPTSSGEIYDMYGMTAAHPTLPIPSYARVTNIRTNRTVVVRVNDRGPFLHDRVIDLSYAAAYRIGTLSGGSGMVDVELVVLGRDSSGQTVAGSVSGSSQASRPAAALSGPSQPEADTRTPAADAPAGQQTAVLKEVSGSQGVFLQLGAFSAKDNAEGFLSRVKGQAAELSSPVEVFLRDGLYRVQSGPYPSDGHAREAAEKLASRLGVKVIVTSR
jgi:rare lipoprotein A